jgi:hypothetical protein
MINGLDGLVQVKARFAAPDLTHFLREGVD